MEYLLGFLGLGLLVLYFSINKSNLSIAGVSIVSILLLLLGVSFLFNHTSLSYDIKETYTYNGSGTLTEKTIEEIPVQSNFNNYFGLFSILIGLYMFLTGLVSNRE